MTPGRVDLSLVRLEAWRRFASRPMASSTTSRETARSAAPH